MEKVVYSWVQLSDIHMSHGSKKHQLDQGMVLNRLREDILAGADRGEPSPDAIFLTGDVAFSGAVLDVDEYKKASSWFDQVCEKLNLLPANVFVIPGNHDVQRNIYTSDSDVKRLIDSLRNGSENLDAAISNNKERKRLLSRFRNFLTFACGYAPACNKSNSVNSEGLFWRVTIPTRTGMEIELFGLNSALLCQDNHDYEKLALGNSQLSPLTETEKTKTRVRIVLSHHPIDWLYDQPDAKNWISSSVDIHCFGHIHSPQSEESRSGSGSQVIQVSGGASHCDESEPRNHGYNLSAIVVADGKLQLRIWPRLWSDKNKRFQQDVDNVPDGVAFSTHTLNREFDIDRELTRTPPRPIPKRKKQSESAKGFSRLVALVSRLENPSAKITERAIVKVRNFGDVREVSILVEQDVGFASVSVAIEPVYNRGKLDKRSMQAIIRGYTCDNGELVVPTVVLICPNGVSHNARSLAASAGIQLRGLKSTGELPKKAQLNLDSPLFIAKLEMVKDGQAQRVPATSEVVCLCHRCNGRSKGAVNPYLLKLCTKVTDGNEFKLAVESQLESKHFFCATVKLGYKNCGLKVGNKVVLVEELKFHIHAVRKTKKMDVKSYKLEDGDNPQTITHAEAVIDKTRFDFVTNGKQCTVQLGPCENGDS